jgi:hypothetical protein
VRQHLEGSADGASIGLGTVALGDLSVDMVANWSAANERVLARTTASIALLTLRCVCRFAVRRGWMTVNPVTLLEPAEKPRWRPGKVAILEGDDLARALSPRRELLVAVRAVGLHRPADRRHSASRGPRWILIGASCTFTGS